MEIYGNIGISSLFLLPSSSTELIAETRNVSCNCCVQNCQIVHCLGPKILDPKGQKAKKTGPVREDNTNTFWGRASAQSTMICSGIMPPNSGLWDTSKTSTSRQGIASEFQWSRLQKEKGLYITSLGQKAANWRTQNDRLRAKGSGLLRVLSLCFNTIRC